MFYRQGSHLRKSIEFIAVFGVLIVLDLLFNTQLLENPFHPFLLVMVLFSLRYGLWYGAASFLVVLIYRMYTTVAAGNDIFLLFYDTEQSLPILLDLVLVGVAGIFATSFRERYESLNFIKEELTKDNEHLSDTVTLLGDTQKILRQKVLESDYSLRRIFQIGLDLDQENVQLIHSQAISLLSEMLETDQVAIYHVDQSKRALRLRMRRGDRETFPQSVLLDEKTARLARVVQLGEFSFKTIHDDADEPSIVAPIKNGETVYEVIIIRNVPLRKLNEHELSIFRLVLEWIGTRIMKVQRQSERENKHKRYDGTMMYKKADFDELVAVEEAANADGNNPFGLIAIQLEQSGLSPVEIELTIRPKLREVDSIGFDEDKQVVFILLPGTSIEAQKVVETRLAAILENKGVTYEYILA